MVKAERDNPLERLETEPAAAPDNALQATVEALRTEVASLRAQIAERDERDAAVWMPLKRAAGNLDMAYQTALAWAARAIKDGRLHEAYKVGGRVVVNLTALTAYRDLLARQ